jgi:tape measure domain-containing protein
MIIGDMEIRLRADIARLQRDMDSARQVVGNATAGMERAANAAKGAIASIAGALGVQQLGRMVDEYAKFTSQLKLATTSQREYAAAYADVKRIATQSTQGLMETGILYARIANGTRELGVEQKKVSQIVETVNLALVVSGAAASESASAQLQLSQAFASGTLRGEEFNAVNESAPRLMKALADGMGLPVGALKKMAEEGKITSKIMADVLPAALEKLRVEAKEIQTISGAFTVLRNNVMEFVGIQAKASGAVSGLVSVIGLLSSNLGLLAGVITTLGVSKLVTMFQSWGVATYKQIADNNALRTSTLAGAVASTEAASVIAAAKLAEAQANVRTAATAANLATARVAELRSSVLAAEGAVALAIATNGLIPAQARAIALSEAHALALAGQAVAANGATVSAGAASAALTAQAAATGVAARAMGVLRGAMMFMGGPIGTIITLLGLAATAWMVWGNKSKEATEKAAESFDEAQVRIIKGLDEQIDKNEKLLKLRNLGVAKSDAEKQLPFVNQLAAASERLNQINMRAGAFAGKSNTDIEFARIGVLRDITDLTQKMAKAESTGAAVAAQSVDERVKAFKKEHATKQEQMAAELKAIEDLKGKTAEYGEMERRIREKYADKGIAQGIKAEATAYQNLVTSIGEKAAANELELSGYAKLSDSQKMTIKLDEAIASGKNKLTPAHVAETRALIAKVAAQESAIEEGAFYLQQSEQQAQLSAAAIKTADDEADRNEELARTFGMSKVAIEQMTLARLEEKLAQADTSKGYTREIAELEAVIDAKRRSVVAISQVDQMETSKKAAEQAAEDWKRAGEDINRSLTDALLRGFESGKSFGKNLIDTLKNMFSTLVLRPVISAALRPLSAGLTGSLGLAGTASAATGAGGGVGSIGSMASLANGASNLYGSLTGGATLAGGMGTGFLGSLAGGLNGAGMGSGLTSALGMNIGNGIASVVGPNVASGIASGLSGLAAAAPWAAGALAVYTIGKKAFGRGPKEYTGDQTLNGSIGAGGFAGTMDAAWVKKGGWFRSDKDGFDKNPVKAEVSAGLTSAYDAIKTTSADFARALGINADSIATRTQAIKIAMGKDEAANQKAIADFFTGVANTVAGELLPEIAKFQAQGEEASSTLQRLAVNYTAMDQILVVMGATSKAAFGAVGTASLEARERLLGFAGGIDALASKTTFFNENFLSQAEQIAIIQKPLTEQLTALGYAGLTTTDQFKVAVQGLVESGALATERGAEQYAGLLALGPQFKVFADHLKEVGDAAKATALEEENRVRQLGLDKLQLSIQIMELEGNALGALTARRAQELTSVDESLRPHYQRIYVLQDEKTALAASTAATQAATQAARDAAATLMSDVDSSFSVMQKVADREKRVLQEQIAVRTQSVQSIQSLSDALRGMLDGMSPTGREAEDRREAQAQIQGALAIGKASGVLPDVDSLKGALSVLGKDSAGQFATQQEYLRDFYTTRLGIEDLAGLTDDALSIEEQSLKKLEDQVTQYDRMLERTQEQIDIAKGQSTVGLSIEQTLQAVLGALVAAKANPVNAAIPVIGGAYQSALGRAPDAAGQQFWQDKAAQGVSQSEIEKAISNSPEAKLKAIYQSALGRPADAAGLQFWMDQVGKGTSYSEVQKALEQSDEAKKLKVPGYAVGGDHVGGWRIVGENGPELEATGPARIFNASQTQGMMRRLASPQENSAVLAAAVDRLTATAERQERTISRLQTAMDKNERNTKRMADGLEVVTDGFNAMRIKEKDA